MGDVLLAQLTQWGVSMRGKIYSRQRCPNCGHRDRYKEQSVGRGQRILVCECGFTPTQVDIILWWDGKTHRISHDQAGKRFQSYIHADRALGLINNQIEKGSFDPALWKSAKSNRLLWQNYLNDYLDREAKRLLPNRKATHDRKKSLTRHMVWFNDRTIREIKASHLQDFASLPCLEMALSPKTRADLTAELRFILRQAEFRQDIEKAPPVPSVKVPKRKKRWLSMEQQARVLRFIHQVHQPIFFFMMLYGSRVSEACALCWDCINLEQKSFLLARTFSRRRLIDTTKTWQEHDLPIVGWFEDYLAGVPIGIGKAPVFRNPEADTGRNPSQFYLPDFLNKVWSEAVSLSGYEPIDLKNATRHSAGNQRRREGWDYELIARLLGHASTTYTKSAYVDDDKELLREKLVRSGRQDGKELVRLFDSTKE